MRSSKPRSLRVTVRDMATARAVLHAGKVDFTEPMQWLVIGLETAMGATLVFEPAG